MSRRLNIPMSELLAEVPPSAGMPNMVQAASDMAYALDRAAVLIKQHRAGEAVQILNGSEQQYQGQLAELNPYLRYRLHYLRGMAHLRLDEPAPARHELAAAMNLSGQLDDSDEDVERVRDAIGLAFYQQGMARLALEQHEQCLAAVQKGTVKDLDLRLSIQRNLANDYAALNDPDKAVQTYQDSAALLGEMATLEQQAAGHWTLSQSYGAENDITRAQRHANRALSIYQAADNLATGAQMNIQLASILIGRKEVAEAQQLLERAQSLLQATGNQFLLSTVYEQYAMIALQQQDMSQAASYAQQALQLAEQQGDSGANDAQGTASRSQVQARALRLAGMIEEQQGHTAEADTLFKRAIDLVSESGAAEIASDLELTYAEMLSGRGAHEQAALHYRSALQHRQRQNPR